MCHLGQYQFISTNRPHVPLDRVGWFRPITEEYFQSKTLMGRKHPTQLDGKRGRLVDKYSRCPQFEPSQFEQKRSVISYRLGMIRF